MKFSRFVLLSLAAALVLSSCSKSTSLTAPGPDSGPTLDTTPPPVPEGLRMAEATPNGTNVLEWAPSTAPDLAMYEIFVYAPDPFRDNPFTFLAATDDQAPRYYLDPVGQVTTRYFRVRSVDESGNRSALSSTITVELWPPQMPAADPISDDPPPGRMDP